MLLKWLSVSFYLFFLPRTNYSLPTRQLEKSFRSISAKKYNIAVTSGSTALIGSLFSNEITRTKVATCIHMIPSSYLASYVNGNKTIPISFDSNNLGPCLHDLKAKYQEHKFSAFIYCDYYGSSGNYDDVYNFCNANSITLIRDSSHSHHYKSLSENKYDDEHICYSFQTAKPMSGFEGGMFSTNSPTIASKFCYYGSQSKYQQELSDRDIPFSLDKNLGYGIKYRINPLASASLIPDLLLLSIHNWLIRCLYSLFALHPNKFLNSSLCRLYTKETSFAFCGNLIFSVPNELSLQAFHSFIKAYRLPFYQRDYDLTHFTTSNNINIKNSCSGSRSFSTHLFSVNV